jgi:hypothetical protein
MQGLLPLGFIRGQDVGPESCSGFVSIPLLPASPRGRSRKTSKSSIVRRFDQRADRPTRSAHLRQAPPLRLLRAHHDSEPHMERTAHGAIRTWSEPSTPFAATTVTRSAPPAGIASRACSGRLSIACQNAAALISSSRHPAPSRSSDSAIDFDRPTRTMHTMSSMAERTRGAGLPPRAGCRAKACSPPSSRTGSTRAPRWSHASPPHRPHGRVR